MQYQSRLRPGASTCVQRTNRGEALVDSRLGPFARALGGPAKIIISENHRARSDTICLSD